MSTEDLGRLVRETIERNRNIPAQLDAYSEFVDSPIGKLELGSLYDVFGMILDNLSMRFPDIASKKAANDARERVSHFLMLAGNDPQRVKDDIKGELRLVVPPMSASISERFSRMNVDERRAIDATLRLIRKSQLELLFQAEVGKHLSDAGSDFEKFFAAVKAESPNMRELRYENLIIEKGIFNKLLLKSTAGKQDYFIWVPSYFAKEAIDSLIERVSPLAEHLLLSKLRELRTQGRLESIQDFLDEISTSMGLLNEGTILPEELRDFVHLGASGKYHSLAPLDLDDISEIRLEAENEKKEEERQRAAEEKLKEEALRKEKEQKAVQFRPKQREQTSVLIPSQSWKASSGQASDSQAIYLGKMLDLEQFTKALAHRVPEKDFPFQVREIEDFYLPLPVIQSNGLAVVGSSGSGKSITIRRILDSISLRTNSPRLIVIDQKGEHRGVAWKHKWQVLALVSDLQARQFTVPIAIKAGERSISDSELIADLLQEWLLQIGMICTDQQRARIASLVRSQVQKNSDIRLETIASAISNEKELTQIGQKISKSFSSRAIATRVFSEQYPILLQDQTSVLFDLSGRGLKDPTTKEDRIIISVLLLIRLSELSLKGTIIVIEDMLDRFKSENLRRKTVEIISQLRANGNAIIATSRSQVRDFIGRNCSEILHRISGEKIVNDELSGFRSTNFRNLEQLVGFLPRGYAITSQIEQNGLLQDSAGIRIEELRFSS